MRIWSVACLMACVVLPAGTETPHEGQSPEELAEEIEALEAKLEALKGKVGDFTRKAPEEAQLPSEASPTAGISEEEAKAIAKKAVQEVLDSLEENREEIEAPSDGEENDLCSVHAWLGHGSGGYPESAAKRTDHLRPCPPMWGLGGGGTVFHKERFMIVRGYPQGIMHLRCNQNYQDKYRIQVSIQFKDHWHHDFPDSITDPWTSRVRRKQDRVHLQLGFSSQVQAAGDGEGFTLKQTTLDYDWPHRPWPKPPRWIYNGRLIKEQQHETSFYGEEAAALIRKIYHSEAFSWTDRKIGETNTVLTGEVARPSLARLLDLCGYSLGGTEISSPSQASQR